MISRSTEYAIRALTLLARENRPGPTLSREIARELGLPTSYLSKLLGELTAVGVLQSQRGRSGGFQLALPPAEITLFQIAAPFDRFGETATCILGQDTCSDANGCPLHTDWSRIKGEFLDLLHATTLADVAQFSGNSIFPHSDLGVRRHHREP